MLLREAKRKTLLPGPLPPESPPTDMIISRVISLAEIMAGLTFYEYQKDFLWHYFEAVLEHKGSVLTALFSRQCLPGNTVIQERDGRCLQIKDHPLAWKTGVKPVYEVKISGGGVLRCTDNHPIMRPDCSFTELSNLSIGERVMRQYASQNRIRPDLVFDGRRECANRVEAETLLLYLSQNGIGATIENNVVIRQEDNLPSKILHGVDGEILGEGKIISIEPVGEMEVWDVRYPGKDWFVAGGVCVHNSGKSECVADGNGALALALPFLSKQFPNDWRFNLTDEQGHYRGFRNGINIGIYAPKREQAQITLEKLRGQFSTETSIQIMEEMGVEWDISNGATVGLSNGSAIRAISASPQSHIEGASHNIMLLEECLAGDTLVLCEDGVRRTIKNLGECWEQHSVLSYDFEINKPVFEKISAWYDRGERHTIKLTLDNGFNVTCTPEHLVHTIEDGWVEAQYCEGRTVTLEDIPENFNTSLRYSTSCSIKVTNIEPFLNIRVYDLTLPQRHWFFANGILVHNCQDMDTRVIEKSLSPMLSSTNGVQVMIGTASFGKSKFYKTIHENMRMDVLHNTRSHFFFPAEVCMRYNSMYRQYVEREKMRLGEDSDAYITSYMCQFILERGMFITEQTLFDPAIAMQGALPKFPEFARIYEGGMDQPPKKYDIVAGIDFAKQKDATVVTVLAVEFDNPLIDKWVMTPEGNDVHYLAYQRHIVGWLILNNVDYETQYTEIREYLSRWSNLKRVVVDATGLGQVMYDRFVATLGGHVEVTGVLFSAQSNSEMYKFLAAEIAAKRITFPYSEEAKKTKEVRRFITEMLDAEKNYKDGGRLVVAAPDEANAHDDMCLSSDTEILTVNGFQNMQQYDGSAVANYYPNTKHIKFKKPFRVINKPFFGEMYHFYGEQISQLVTPGHKMLFTQRRRKNKKTVIKPYSASSDFLADYLKGYRLIGAGFIKAGYAKNKADFSKSAHMKMAGWMISEGWFCQSKKKGWNDGRYMLAQSEKAKPKYVKEIDELVQELGLDYNRYVRPDGIVIWQFRKASKKFFEELLPDGVHRIPSHWFYTLSSYHFKVLLKTLMKGDGHMGSRSYATKSETLAKQVQLVAALCGVSASIHRQKPRKWLKSSVISKKSFDKHAGERMWVVYLHDRRKYHDQAGLLRIEKNFYDGDVWCVTSHSGFIVIRHNNKISITGNCDSLALAVHGTKEPPGVGAAALDESEYYFLGR